VLNHFFFCISPFYSLIYVFFLFVFSHHFYFLFVCQSFLLPLGLPTISISSLFANHFYFLCLFVCQSFVFPFIILANNTLFPSLLLTISLFTFFCSRFVSASRKRGG